MKTTCALLLLSSEQSWTVRAFSLLGEKQVCPPPQLPTHRLWMRLTQVTASWYQSSLRSFRKNKSFFQQKAVRQWMCASFAKTSVAAPKHPHIQQHCSSWSLFMHSSSTFTVGFLCLLLGHFLCIVSGAALGQVCTRRWDTAEPGFWATSSEEDAGARHFPSLFTTNHASGRTLTK